MPLMKSIPTIHRVQEKLAKMFYRIFYKTWPIPTYYTE